MTPLHAGLSLNVTNWPTLRDMVFGERRPCARATGMTTVAGRRSLLPQPHATSTAVLAGCCGRGAQLDHAGMTSTAVPSQAVVMETWKAVLERSLGSFSALTKGETFRIFYNKKKYDIGVVEVKPEGGGFAPGAPEAVSIIEADVEVDFEAPADYVEPARVSPLATSPPGSAFSAITPLTRARLWCAASTAQGTASPCSGGSLGQTHKHIQSVGRQAAWLADRLVGRQSGSLAGWLARRQTSRLPNFPKQRNRISLDIQKHKFFLWVFLVYLLIHNLQCLSRLGNMNKKRN